jgi:TonB-dependent receptor
MFMKYLGLLFIQFICFTVFTQVGTLQGTVIDETTKETLPGAKVLVENSTKVTLTDFDGKFTFNNLTVGTHKISISYSTYTTKQVEIQIQANQISNVTISLSSIVSDQEEVVVKGTMKKDSEASVLLERKNAAIVTDGISAQSIKKAGDGDVSGAAKRITGVTIRNGKYIYVRGLGDRYTQTTLNGMVIPGLDPDVNAIQLDIFPTSIIENLNVSKTCSADLYGDFTGGLVNIVTKKFPGSKNTQISLGLDYNPSMHFNKDFMGYNHSATDWLGFDNGQRALPTVDGVKLSKITVPDEVQVDPMLQKITQSFNNQLAAQKNASMPNGSFSITHGNQIKKNNDLTIGYFTSLNYSNENIFYKGYETNEYLKEDNVKLNNLSLWSSRLGNISKNNVMWSALSSLSLKYKKHNFQITALHLQNGESSAMVRTSNDYNSNVSTLAENILSYTSRRLSNAMISGNHSFNKFIIDWSNSFSLSNVNEPDYRETKISITNGDTTLSTGGGAGIDRFWRELNETTESFKGDITYKFTEKTNLKTGFSGSYKSRDFFVFAYKHRPKNLSAIEFDPNWFLSDDQIWNPQTRQGTYTIGNYEPTNNFSANQNTLGTYLMMNHPIRSKINLSYGIRLEKFKMYYTGQNNSGSIVLNNEQTMDELNILPSANINITLTDKMNLRFAAGNSVARPSFKEKSVAQIYDPITKRIFNGNIDLKQTKITNFDARYEFFFSGTELFAVSGFYKQFDGHIEMVSFATAPNNITPRNSGFASILGSEIEFRKSLANRDNHKILSRFSINMNVSFVSSRVDLKSVIVDNTGQTEYELRMKNKREDQPDIANTRPMAGQSPYSINTGLSYDIPETETNITISYNIQGEQLSVISSGRVPDVYTDPFNSLNLNAYKTFGKNKKSKITLGATNLLQDRIAFVYKSYGTDSQVYSSYKPGVQFSAKYNYTF